MTDRLLTLLNDSGDALLRWTMWMNAWTAAMLLGAVVIDRALRSRVGAGWRMALYGAVLLRLMLPTDWSSPVGLLNSGSALAHGASAPAAFDAVQTTILRSASAADPADMAADAAPVTLTWTGLLPLIYAAGLAALLARALAARAGLRRILAESAPASPDLAALAAPLPVRVHDRAGPMLTGRRRPTLVLPASLASDPCADRTRWIIAHEQAHARRADPWLALGIHALAIAAWPVLAIWLAGSRLRALMEQACDERALAGRSDHERLGYARALIDAIDAPRRRVVRPALAAPALEFGVGLRERIAAVRRARRWRGPWQAACAVAGAAGLVACAATRADRPAAAHDEPAPATASLSERLLLPQDDPRPIRLEFTLLERWPSFPWLDATSDGRGPKNGGIQSLYAHQRDELLAAAAKSGSIITSPAIVARPGQQAAIQVDGDGQRGLRITASATRRKGGHDLLVSFAETGPDARAAGPMPLLSWSDGAEVVPIRESRPGQGGLLLLVRVTDETEDAIGWPLVFYRVNRVELAGAPDFAAAVETSGGRRIDGVQTPAGVAAAAYTLPAEFVESLYTKLNVPDMQRFRIGHETHAQAASGERAKLTLTRRPRDPGAGPVTDELTLTGTLAPPADRPGPPQGGSLSVGLTWTASPGAAVDVPVTRLANFDAAAHQLVIAAWWPGDAAKNVPPRLLVVMPHRAGSEDDLPRQTMEIKPQTAGPMKAQP